ncbi:acid phosphatase 1-like [Vitis riparia]|uniref:acid phosphatase 1-like n=1 Tax=Vitis riparia TaxID=96939 RepID=UPI00155A6724|nr:acid phosphatase 1-like [Vitis riparia]
MDSGRLLLFSLSLALISRAFSDSLIRITPDRRSSTKLSRDDVLFCDSWRFTVETNDAGVWVSVPDRCVQWVKDYMTGDRYRSDSEFAADDSLSFAKTVQIAGDGKDVWVFDIDETLLSNLPYYAAHGFGSEAFDETTFDEWVNLAEAPALQASLRLYREVEQLGFKIVLITGRIEPQRNVTEKNLVYAGYSNWERLFLRGRADSGKTALVYKSEKRRELEDEGYRIHGSSGDQWSDLLGFAVARRSFKLPNPMYYIP